jgi:HD-GYP domain-containing protein (c-di-GMP phosphodiesterase class II)
MARALDVTDDELPVVALGALMHDIGKVFVEGSLLSKEAPLTEPELETIRLHPLLGEALLSPNVSDATVLGIVRWHHERWDGSGYPDGLRAGSIPLSARIVAAADAYTAMCEARAYRRPLGPHAALDELQRLSGTQFDGDCVEALVRSFAEDVSSRSEALSA